MHKPFGRVFSITILLTSLLALALPAAASVGPPIIFTGTLNFDTNPYADYPEWITAGTAASATLDCVATSDLDPFLIVYGPTGSVVDFNDDGGVSLCKAYGSALAFTAATSGFYTFRASSWDYARGGR